jgi:RimJ/RimL family protein N-acetyltransferase
MALAVREMGISEVDIVIDYFHDAAPEHLEMLGVDPTKLPGPSAWRERLHRQFSPPMNEREYLVLLWLLDDAPIGFSSCDKIKYGERANMHLHIAKPERRHQGLGTEFVRRSIEIYFKLLNIKAIYCEPNALNVAPNRTLQRAGFRYVKTHWTVPAPLNYHQAVTRWVIER